MSGIDITDKIWKAVKNVQIHRLSNMADMTDRKKY
jgi:hypothetical protein